jgi:hypothetical protein
MTNIISTTITTTYLHHNLPVPHLPPFRRVNQMATQNNFPLAAWSCGTIAILTTLHLTLGQFRPDNINTDIINRRHVLIFHQTLLQWFILGTPPNLRSLNCINRDIIRGEPIKFSEAHARCEFMQSLNLPSGCSTIPHLHQTHNTPLIREYANPNTAPRWETVPTLPFIPRGKKKPPTIPHQNNSNTPTSAYTSTPFTKFSKPYPILRHQERQKRIAAAR